LLPGGPFEDPHLVPMPKKQPFPPEADTEPGDRAATRQSGPAPKSKRERANAPTEPPPKGRKTGGKAADTRTSGVLSRKPSKPGSNEAGGATVDEVVADLAKDPRRERD
jgi:hypothetical protein